MTLLPLPPPDETATPPPPASAPLDDPDEDGIRRHMLDEALTSAHLRRSIEVCLRRRSSRPADLIDEVDEVVQEVAARALDRLPTFDRRASLALPWLMGIAVNVLRERARHPFGERRPVVRQSSCSEAQWDDILDRLRVEPRVAEEPSPVWQALPRLKPDEQRVIRLRFAKGHPYAEIALALGITEVAARARLCRALHALRRQLPPDTTP